MLNTPLNCVVEAINRQLAVLASDAPDEKRLMALKYVVHFVAMAARPPNGRDSYTIYFKATRNMANLGAIGRG